MTDFRFRGANNDADGVEVWSSELGAELGNSGNGAKLWYDANTASSITFLIISSLNSDILSIPCILFEIGSRHGPIPTTTCVQIDAAEESPPIHAANGDSDLHGFPNFSGAAEEIHESRQ